MTSVTAEIGTEEWCSVARSPNIRLQEMGYACSSEPELFLFA